MTEKTNNIIEPNWDSRTSPGQEGMAKEEENQELPTSEPEQDVSGAIEVDSIGSEFRAEFRESLYLQRQLKSSFSRFVPRRLLRLLGSDNILDINLGDEVEMKLAVMFCDIRNFTTLSEGFSSRDTFDFINSYLSSMEPPLHYHGGIIDKFIGDSVMAVFPSGADDALKASISMRRALLHFNEPRIKFDRLPIEVGIGLNTGILTLGVIGHLERMETTVIGDAVNVASRIESLTKRYRVNTLVSEDIIAGLTDQNAFSIRFVGRLRVKGRHSPVSIYEVFDGDDFELARKKLAQIENFEHGVAFFHLGRIEKALGLFELCAERAPGDTTAEYYIEQCKTLLVGTAPEIPNELLNDLEWKKEYNTGISKVDEQHLTLFENIKKLSQAIKQEDVSVISEVFNFLEEYAVLHFKTEEYLMRKYNYPLIEDHIREHESFVRAFLLKKRDILSGRHDKLLTLYQVKLFLTDWLITHSSVTDKHFAKFVLAKTEGELVN